MKFLSVLAILSVAALASAAPCSDEAHTHEDGTFHEEASDLGNTQVTQAVGSVGGGESGILTGILGSGLLSSTSNTNYVTQNAQVN